MRRLFLSVALLPLPAWADAPRVVTDIAPIHSLVARVMEGVGAPDLLVDGASDPHAFQLKPSQASALQDAQMIVWIGPEMTPWLDRIVDGLADPAASLILMEVEGLTEREPMFGEHEDHEGEEHAEEEAHEEHAEEEGHEEHAEEEGHDEHAHGEHDPHIWLDPTNASAIVRAVAARLSELDPDNATVYAANASAAEAELAALDAELKGEFDPVKSRPVIVFHDAYAHLADRYGLTIVGALAEGDAADPGAEQVAELRAMIEADKVECVFTEALHSDKLIATLTDDLAVPVGRLDPEGTTLQPGASVYPEMMRALAGAFVTCQS
jgi:zinc transport system substrate-binding protein